MRLVLSTLVPLTARLVLLAYCLTIPGLALARWLGVNTRNRIDAALITLMLSLSSLAAATTLLLLGHAYTRPTLFALLAGPAIYLWRQRFARPRALVDRVRVESWNSADALELAILGATVIFLCIYVVDALTSPVSEWDGLVTWGKWTADWGRRTGSGDYVVGGYPQLVPRFLSVLYKVDGTSLDILPLDTFVIHGFHVLMAGCYVLAAVRLAQLLRLPSWPLLLVAFGSTQFRQHVGAGSMDVTLAAVTLTLLALFVAYRRREWEAARGPWIVLGAGIFVCVFTKATGVLSAAFLTALWFEPSRERETGRQLGRALALAAALMLPFVLEQGLSEWRARVAPLNSAEVNLPLGRIPRILAEDATITYHGGGLSSRPAISVLRFWNDYDVPASLRWPMSVLLVCLVVVGGVAPGARPLLAVLVIYGTIWLAWSSYDQRNLFHALPVIAILAGYGASRIAVYFRSRLLRAALALSIGILVLLPSGALLKDLQARSSRLLAGDSRLSARLVRIDPAASDRVPFFFPKDAADYKYLLALEPRTGGRHVLTTSPLFRFFPDGLYVSFLWPTGLTAQGDLFAGHDYYRPTGDDRWVLIATPHRHRVWVLDKRLAAAPISTLSTDILAKIGLDRELMVGAAPADFEPSGFMTWQVSLQSAADAGIHPAFATMHPEALDTTLTSTAMEIDTPRGLVRCSGIVVLRSGESIPPPDLRVGVRVNAGVAVTVASFRVSAAAAQPPQAASGPVPTESAR